MTLASLGAAFANMTAIVVVRYLVVAAAIHGLLWVRKPVRAVRLSRRTPSAQQVRGEIALSVVSSAIYAAPAALAMRAWQAGGTRMFSDLSPQAWPTILLGTTACLLLQDAFYYWAHRAMHWRPVFKALHAGHHRHPEPSPFAGFAFDPLEAVLTGWLLPALVFVIPVEVHVAVFMLMLTTVTGVINHSGWEVWPHRWVDGRFGRWVVTPVHHSQHHTRFGTNFGLYFQHWDRWFGTQSEGVAHPAWRARKAAAIDSGAPRDHMRA
ncbi:MAG: sterol desaturase family protein [Caulobacteraceae bacterium]|nr:sterol desaturase family protein [Caulobacter sp.]